MKKAASRPVPFLKGKYRYTFSRSYMDMLFLCLWDSAALCPKALQPPLLTCRALGVSSTACPALPSCRTADPWGRGAGTRCPRVARGCQRRAVCAQCLHIGVLGLPLAGHFAGFQAGTRFTCPKRGGCILSSYSELSVLIQYLLLHNWDC